MPRKAQECHLEEGKPQKANKRHEKRQNYEKSKKTQNQSKSSRSTLTPENNTP
jgi:hypothetical protein